MPYKLEKTVVIALGGSIVFPRQIDWRFLKQFRRFLKRYLNRYRFVIVVGGGNLSRTYQEAAGHITRVTDEDKDWLGIHATRSNAQLLRTIFREVADPVVIDQAHKIRELEYPITIASGWRPGWSTDYIAAALTLEYKVRTVLVAGKPAFVYDKDHAAFADAQPIKKLRWKDYRRLIPRRWKPGIHAPVDPIAAKLLDAHHLTAIIIRGTDLANFKAVLDGKEFRGTIIL